MTSNKYTIEELTPLLTKIAPNSGGNLANIDAILEIETRVDENAVSRLATILAHVDDAKSTLEKLSFLRTEVVPNNEMIIKNVMTFVSKHGGSQIMLSNLRNLLEFAPDESGFILQCLAKINVELIDDDVALMRKILPSMNNIGDFNELVRIINLTANREIIPHLVRASEHVTASGFYTNLRKAIEKYPDTHWEDVFSQGQMDSKLWLIGKLQELGVNLGTTYVLGGWIGSLSYMLGQSDIPFDKIYSFDIDPNCAAAAEALNKEMVNDKWRFKAQTFDIMEMEYGKWYFPTLNNRGEEITVKAIPDTIINTSSEHIDHVAWLERIPAGKLVVIQNNNFKDVSDHINTHDSLESFINRTKLTNILYSGELELPQYTRYMIIGYK